MTEQNELPPEIIRDDIAILREEYFQRLGLAIETWNEITRRIADARQKGIEV